MGLFIDLLHYELLNTTFIYIIFFLPYFDKKDNTVGDVE